MARAANPKPRSTPAAAPARTGPAPMGDNSMHGEESERVQLISIVSQLSAAEDAIETAMGPVRAAQAKRKTIIGLGKAAGFTAGELKARLEEMKRPTRENASLEQRERKHRRWLGIVDADQQALLLGDKAPQSAKDEAHWKGEGYKAGLRMLPNKAPPECPAVHEQAYMKEHERGFLEATTANAPKPKAPTVAEQAAKDFAEDNPEKASLADERLAEKREENKVREALENLPGAADPEAGFPVAEDEEPV